jgi:excinuclease ABC subunit C
VQVTKEELKDKAHSLPLHPGVYIMMDAKNTVIYVGKAKALRNRVSQYFLELASHTEKTRAMVSQIDHFDVILADTEFEALVLECSLIKRHKPKYNILLKDDKGYPYVRLNRDLRYPRFSIVGRTAEDGASYFGPFGTRGATTEILDAISLALHLPTCHRQFPRDIGKERPCLNHHLGNCEGWCRPEMTEEAYRERIDQAVQLLNGDFAEVEAQLREQMEDASEKLRFEAAAEYRDRMRAIQLLGKRQNVVATLRADVDVCGFYLGQAKSCFTVLHFLQGDLAGRDSELFPTPVEEDAGEVLSALVKQYYGGRGNLPKGILLPQEIEDREELQQMFSQAAGRRVEVLVPQRGHKVELVRMAEQNAADDAERATTKEERQSKLMELLGSLLGLPSTPHRTESYDISNTGSADIVAAQTVFYDGKPLKGEYRYYKLRDMDTPDDYASMEQVLTRRFQRWRDGDEKFSVLPDVLLMDGGLGQVSIAVKVLQEFDLHIPVFGMVKDNRHRTRALVAPDGREIGIQSNPALFALIGRMQEETHRSAIGFHHKQHQKTVKGSELDKIEGIGKQRRAALLKHFKSIKAIRAASVEQLAEVVPRNAAQAVYQYFNTKEE